MIKSCYIHVPFCKNICSYCDFCKLLYNKSFVNMYISKLEEEIKDLYKGEILSTIYIGGGTPSCLDINELEFLFKVVSSLKMKDNYEFTMECNFDSITKEKLELFKKNGVNRLSFGIESINKNNLAFLDRYESKEKIINTINLAKSLGFNNINVDLMYAIPNESMDTLKNDIDFILSLDVEHISTYSLIIEEHTRLFVNKVNYIDEELDFKMYEYICKVLKENGYTHYEISNFSKEGFQSRHNMCYWKNNEYYGFGLGAASYIADYRINNTRSITKYLNGSFVKEKEHLNMKDKKEYEIILGLRLINGINKDIFYQKYGIKLNEYIDYKDLVKNSLLKENDSFLYIPENKLYISNEILVNLLNRI